MGKMRRVAIYVRVSTDGQTTTNQQRELEAVVKRHGWEIVEMLKDYAIGGKSGHQTGAHNVFLVGIDTQCADPLIGGRIADFGFSVAFSRERWSVRRTG